MQGKPIPDYTASTENDGDNSGDEDDNSGDKDDNSGAKADNSRAKAENSGAKADNSGVKADNSGDKADNSGDKADNSGVKADNSGDKADNSGDKADNSGDKGDNSGDKDEVPLEKEFSKTKECPLKKGIPNTTEDLKETNIGESNKETSGEIENGNHHPTFFLEEQKIDKQDDCNNNDDENQDCYTINCTKNHGLAFILSYGQFESDSMTLPSRHTSMKDMYNMKGILEQYGFQVQTCHNGTRQKTLDFLHKVIKEWETGKYDILIGALSSHGDEVVEARTKRQKHEVRHRVICSDGEAIYTYEDIVSKFDTSTNKGKPKLYFIQACRSRFNSGDEAKDSGVSLSVSETSGTDKNQQQKLRGQDTADARHIRPPPEKGQGTADARGIRPPTEKLQDTADARGIRPPTEKLQDTADARGIRPPTEKLQDTADARGIEPPPAEGQVRNNDNFSATGEVLDTSKKKDLENESLKNSEEGKKMTDISKDESNTSVAQLEPEPEQEIHEIFPPPCTLDSLVMFASASGKFAYAGSESGGWLLHLVEEALKSQKEKNIELTQLLTEYVSYKMALAMETINDEKEKSGLKSVPCIMHMLHKDIFLRPLPSDQKK